MVGHGAVFSDVKQKEATGYKDKEQGKKEGKSAVNRVGMKVYPYPFSFLYVELYV